MIGVPVPGISTIGLGRSSVYGRSRDPWPPARITACVGNVCMPGTICRARQRDGSPRSAELGDARGERGVADGPREAVRPRRAVLLDGRLAQGLRDGHAVPGERGAALDGALEVRQ